MTFDTRRKTMAEYTYADVIIDPNDPRVEIGKEYYFGDNPTCLLKDISQLSAQEGKLILKDLAIEAQSSPFMSSGNKWFVCIIRKKMEYTEADIISDLNDPRLKGAIGKVCYVAPWLYGYDIVINANNDNTTYKGVLVNLGYDPSHPFEVHTEMGLHWKDIIIAKNQPEKKYVPFDLSKEKDRAKLRGAWVKAKKDPDKHQNVCGVCSQYVFLSCQAEGYDAEDFLESFTFIDGTPCGKLVEE